MSTDNIIRTSFITGLPGESDKEFLARLAQIEVDNGRVVAPTSGFGEFGLLTKDDAKPGSGYYPQTEQILLRSLGENDVDYNPERVLVDDLTQNASRCGRPGMPLVSAGSRKRLRLAAGMRQ